MKLYLRREVMSYSYKRWGGPSGLEAERERREALKYDRSLTRTKVSGRLPCLPRASRSWFSPRGGFHALSEACSPLAEKGRGEMAVLCDARETCLDVEAGVLTLCRGSCWSR